MAKQVTGKAAFQVPGGKATPAPPVGINRYDNWNRSPIELLGPLVELRDELTQIDPELAQRRSDRWSRRRLAPRHLKCRLACDLLGHV